MTETSTLKVWLRQTRANFLLLSVFLVLIGAAAAHLDGSDQWLKALLCIVGVVLAHISVNLFNEHSDHKTGIDRDTPKTPFSGGSGTLQQGLTTPKTVAGAAWGTLGGAFLIGAYLSWVSTWHLVWLMILGGATAVFYTTHLAKWSLGELAAGLCLGTLVVMGTYMAMTATLTWPVVILSIPPGILTAALLLLNEFPDAEADEKGGRRHLVILLGKSRAALLYSGILAAVYITIGASIILGVLPGWCALSLLTLPLAVKAALTASSHHNSLEKLLPAQGMNVATVLLTDLLLAVGLFLA